MNVTYRKNENGEWEESHRHGGVGVFVGWSSLEEMLRKSGSLHADEILKEVTLSENGIQTTFERL